MCIVILDIEVPIYVLLNCKKLILQVGSCEVVRTCANFFVHVLTSKLGGAERTFGMSSRSKLSSSCSAYVISSHASSE